LCPQAFRPWCRYNAQNPVGDRKSDGVFNFAEVKAFLAAYQAGCP
jgi:hypothetical protein